MESKELPQITTLRTLDNGTLVLEFVSAAIFLAIPVSHSMIEKLADEFRIHSSDILETR